MIKRLFAPTLFLLSTLLPAQDPAEAAVTPELAAPPEITAPATVEEGLAVDVAAFKETLQDQPAERIEAVLTAWMALIEEQTARVQAAAAATDGSKEREQLGGLRADQGTLIARAEVLIEALAKDAGENEARKATVESARAVIADVRQQESQEAQEIGTCPKDPRKALSLDLGVLRAELRPLVKTQVEEDLANWLKHLQDKSLEVRNVEIASLTAESDADIDRHNEKAVALRNERDALIARVRVVINSYEAKTGDVTEANAYVDSVVVGPEITGLRAAWVTFRSWLFSAEGGLALATSIGLFFGILIAFKILAGLLGRLVDRGLRTVGKSSDLLRSFMVNSVRKVTMLIGVVIAVSQLGVNVGPLLAAIGAAGFVIGFALQGTLSNFASGVMMMMYRPFEIGDAVSAAGVTGKVNSMTLVSTTILTFDNQTIVVPNNKIWGDVITNITANRTRRVDMTFGIGYGDDIAKAEKVLNKVLEDHPKVLKDPAPVVQVHELGDSSVNFVVRPWALTDDYWTVYWDITRTVKERFDAAEISIPFPQRDVHLHGAAVPAPEPQSA